MWAHVCKDVLNWFEISHIELCNWVSEWVIKFNGLSRTELCNWNYEVPTVEFTRCSENDSTLGWPRSENANFSWVWPFHAISMLRFVVNYIMPPNFTPWCHFLNFIFLAQAYHEKFQSSVERAIGRTWPEGDLLHGTVHYPTKLQADSWNPWRIRAVTSFRTDRRTDGRPTGHNDRRQYPSTPMATEDDYKFKIGSDNTIVKANSNNIHIKIISCPRTNDGMDFRLSL